MKAAILEQLNAPLTVADLELPDGLTHGQVRVRVLASGICGAQLQEIQGFKGNAKYLPHLLGHEGCGIVEAIGPNVTRVRPHDRVVMHWRKGGGLEAAPAQYQWGRAAIEAGERTGSALVGGGPVTTFCEEAVVSENRLTAVPPETPIELCALLGCGLSTALATIEFEAQLRWGETILIVGCGGLGLNLIHAARLMHAGEIAVLEQHEGKRSLAGAAGAEFFATVGPNSPRRFDVIVDTTGAPAAIKATLPLLAPSGRYILVGQPPPGAALLLTGANHFFAGHGKSLRATQGGGFRPDEHLARYIRLHASGALQLTGLITHRYALADVNAALDVVRAGQAGRVLLEMN